MIERSIDNAIEKLEWFMDKQDTKRKNIFMNYVEALLSECQKDSPFSAVSATTLHNSDAYKVLKGVMEVQGIWTDYMQTLHDDSLGLILPGV